MALNYTVVTIAIERICTDPSYDSDREVIYGHGTCVYLVGPSAPDLRPLNGTDVERDSNEYIVRESR